MRLWRGKVPLRRGDMRLRRGKVPLRRVDMRLRRGDMRLRRAIKRMRWGFDSLSLQHFCLVVDLLRIFG
jgi:hypothetical protein